MVLLTTAFVVLIVGALYYYFTRTFNYWKNQNVPGPDPVPFYGNLLKSSLRFCSVGEIIKDIYDSYPSEKVVGVFRMTNPCLLVRDLDIVKHVMIKDFDNFVDRGVELSQEGLGQNLFHSDGDTWRALRSRFSPIFTNQKLKNMMHLLNDRAHKFSDYVSEITSKTPEHEIYLLVQKYTMSTISACAFGLDIDTFRGEVPELKRIDKAIFTTNFFNEIVMMYPDLLKRLNMSIFPNFIKVFFKELVQTVMSERKGMPSNRKDFMELRNKKEVQGGKRFGEEDSKTVEITDNLIESQAFLFYAAGYETTASTMGFMLYHLAIDQEIQDRVRQEIDEYLQRHDNQIELETINELKYLEQVFSETLRLYPIVDVLQRRADHTYQCPGTDVTVQKGQVVLISTIGIQRDEKYYPNALKFNPENFAPENEASRHPCAYLPFGVGPRHCIGMRFAQVQSRVCVIRLLAKFKLTPCPRTVRTFGFDPCRVVLAPNKKLYVNVRPRDDL